MKKYAVSIYIRCYETLSLGVVEAPTLKEAVIKYSLYNMRMEDLNVQKAHSSWLDNLPEDLYNIQEKFYEIEMDLEAVEVDSPFPQVSLR